MEEENNLLEQNIHNENRDLRRENRDVRLQLQELENRLNAALIVNQGGVVQAPAVVEAHENNYTAVPHFYGRRGDNFVDWIRFFEQFSDTKGWDDDQKLLQFPIRLRDAAWVIFNSLRASEKDTWEHCKTYMTQRLLGGAAKRTNVLAFHERNQMPGETAFDYARALKKAYQAAYPMRRLVEHDEELQLRFEEGALYGSEITHLGPCSFDNALFKAENVENSLRKRRNTTAFGGSIAEEGRHQMQDSVEKLTRLVANMSTEVRQAVNHSVKQNNAPPRQSDRNATIDGYPRCNRCNQSGHNAMSCKQKFCSVHGLNETHFTEQCRRLGFQGQEQPKFPRQNQNQQTQLFCEIHQIPGHSLEQCSVVKRERKYFEDKSRRYNNESGPRNNPPLQPGMYYNHQGATRGGQANYIHMEPIQNNLGQFMLLEDEISSQDI